MRMYLLIVGRICKHRGDTVGAITLVLDAAPYGASVEEAKVCVHPYLRVSAPRLIIIILEPQSTNTYINSQQHESVRDP